MRRDLGDFQTPPELVAAVLDTLGPIGARWPRVLEPTCGRGHFLAGLLEHASPPCEIQAIEIQPAHCRAAGERPPGIGDRGGGVTITCADLFRLDLGRDLRLATGRSLAGRRQSAVGHECRAGEPGERPGATEVQRQGPRRARGPDRRLQFRRRRGGLAQAGPRARRRGADDRDCCARPRWRGASSSSPTARGCRSPTASIRRIDAARWFGAAVDACLFRVTLAKAEAVGGGDCRGGIPVYPGLNRANPPRSWVSRAAG